jgi:hypothetical protein
MKKTLFALLINLALVSCDDYEGQEVLPSDKFDGRGVFSGKKGEFEISLGSDESSGSSRAKLRSRN